MSPTPPAPGSEEPSPLQTSLTLRYRKAICKTEITAVGISPSSAHDHAFAISSSSQGRSWVDVFELASQTNLAKFAGSNAVFSPRGDRIATLRDWTVQVGGGVDFHFASTVLVREARSGRSILELKEANSWPLAWSTDGRLLAAGEGRDSSRVGVWDLVSSTRVGRVVSHADTVTHAIFAPDGKLLTQSRDGTVRLTNPATSKTISRLEVDGHRRPYPRALTMSSDGTTVASIWSTTVHLWMPQASSIVSYGLNEVRRTEGWALCVSPDGKRVAHWTEEGFDITDTASGSLLAEQKSDIMVTAGAFSRNGKILLLGKMDGSIEVWDVKEEA